MNTDTPVTQVQALTVPPPPPSLDATPWDYDLNRWRRFIVHLAHGHDIAHALNNAGCTMLDWRRWQNDRERVQTEERARRIARDAAVIELATLHVDALVSPALAALERNVQEENTAGLPIHPRDQITAAQAILDRASDPRLHRTQPQAQGPGGPGVHVHLGVYVVPQAPAPSPAPPRIVDAGHRALPPPSRRG